MAVPTTGWYELKNDAWVFVLPHTTKFSADMPAGELAIFQTEQLHLQHGFAIAGTVDEWRERILEPFTGNSIVTLAVGVALSGPVTPWAGVPPGLFHIFCESKHGKSLASTIGQSVYGRPLIPNETVADPFGMSWLATSNSIGRMILTRSSVGAFFEELNQGKPKDIADTAYRIANGIDKSRLRGRNLEPRLTYCVPGFSTGEEPMVGFLARNGVRVTAGMQTRFADVPAAARPGSVFETYSADEIPGLGQKFYHLVSKLYGAVGDVWLQYLVDMGPEQIKATVNQYQKEFRARPKVQALYAVAAPYQRSVIDRFATVAGACHMATDAGLLWANADIDADIEACVLRWAEREKMDTIVAAIAQVMGDEPSWQGTASQLKTKLNGAIDSADSLGRWIKKSENVTKLKLAGFNVMQRKSKSRARARLIRIERVGVEKSGRLDA
jgi:putative DNA primase/helicase